MKIEGGFCDRRQPGQPYHANQKFKVKAEMQSSFRKTVKVIRLLLLALALLCFGNLLTGQNPQSERKEENLTPAQRKIAVVLRSVGRELAAAGVNSSNAQARNAARQYSTRLVRIDNKARVQVYIDLTEVNAGRLQALAAISDIQIEITDEKSKRIQAWVSYERLEALAALDFVLRIQPPDYAVVRTGSKNSEGDSILKANQVRSTLGITGAGIKVGVISDGANTIASSQASGDLPTPITVFGSCDPAFLGGTCNEGTAMMEIIYDLAPGTILAMGDVSTSLEFIQRVTDLKTWGARVIVDDLGFPSQPYFEDGDVAASYASALAQGIVMVSAAGNDAQSHYQGAFLDSRGAGLHDFGGGDETMGFTVPPGQTARVVLQWSNQFGRSGDDYDLYIYDAGGANVVASSTNLQLGSDNPLEYASVSCNNFFSDCTFNVSVKRFSASVQTLELFFSPHGHPTEHVVSSDSIFGHSAVPGVISVGAINANDTGNVNIAGYSSRGPSTIFFPAFQQRATPSITAVDGVSVTGAGGFPTPFYGTSAAAPHVAAIAALLLEATPSLTPSQVLAAMQSTSADRGLAGFDSTYGSGLVDALNSVNSVHEQKKRRGQVTSS